MKQNLITDVVQAMLPFLNNAQTERLQEVLQHTLFGYEVTKLKVKRESRSRTMWSCFCRQNELRAVPKNLLNTTKQLSR